MKNNITVIIPAYKPEETLLSTIDGLVDIGFRDILVIDDGGGKAYEPIFEKVQKNPNCTLLRHEVNRGKGAALKTAFDYFLENRPDSVGVVTADADGQHLPKDILAVGEKMAETGSTVLGVRDFSDPLVPPRSKSGNRITCGMFRLFFGMKITDTQTGLRAFPTKDLPAIRTAEGDRYEYETNMLYLIDRYKLPLTEVKISTVYINDNSSSHFRVVRDSLRIYSLQIKFLVGFLLSALVYNILLPFIPQPELGFLPLGAQLSENIPVISAGLVAALVHYVWSAVSVFDNKIRFPSLGKSLLISIGIVYVANALPIILFPLFVATPVLNFPAVFAVLTGLCKAVIAILSFFVSFQRMHKWVFRRKI